MQVTGSAMQVTGSAMQVTGSAMQVVGSAMQVVGSTMQAVGSTMQVVGSAMQVKGFTPLAAPHDQQVQKMVDTANQAADRLGLDIEVSAQHFDNDDSFIGERYGVPTPEGMEALRLMARMEGILLDPVYTGKGFAALINHIRAGKLNKEQPVIFLHTGGAPALFAYADDLLAE